METMEKVHSMTRDDYGLQAAGVLSSLEKFHVFFGLKLARILFASAEESSKVLQAKDLLIQDATSAVSVTENFLRRHRKDSEFEMFYSNAVDEASSLQIGEPVLPRYRKKPARFEDGTPSPPVFDSPKTYYCSLYKEAYDLLAKEIEDRFLQKVVMKLIVAMETVIMKAANGKDVRGDFEILYSSMYKNDVNLEKLERQLSFLPHVIQVALPSVKTVTSVWMVCEAMKANKNHELLEEVHKLL